MSFAPHTETDIREMLAAIDVPSIATLFDEVPDELLVKQQLNLPPPLSELAITKLMRARANQDANFIGFIGAGAYDHYIPAAVWELTSRGEFLTAYTPYQAEASQGSLQLIYEYQSMISSLTGMDVSNASLYDGATALTEAILMAIREKEKKGAKKILVPHTLNPFYHETIISITKLLGVELIEMPFDVSSGTVDLSALDDVDVKQVAAMVIQQPNFLGCLESVNELTDWAHEQDLLVIASVNPTSLAILKEPGKWGTKGADIATGEGQPLGIPLASGGPYFGFLTCKQALIRQVPGRLVGRTVDQEGKEGFTLTLQAREQHIRRAKAKSNICTNQGLLVTAATIYLSLMGYEGLKQVAEQCHTKALWLQKALSSINGIKLINHSPFFHEFVIQLNQPLDKVLAYFGEHQMLAGFDISPYFREYPNSLLICVTETKTEQDLANYVKVMQGALS